MSKFKVYVSRKLPEKAMELIKAECDTEVNPYDRAMTRRELEVSASSLEIYTKPSGTVITRFSWPITRKS